MEADMDDIYREIIESGRRLSDGHFTLMAFTTHWKATFLTPDLDGGRGREQVRALRPYDTPEEAIMSAAVDLLRKIANMREKKGRQSIIIPDTEEHLEDIIRGAFRAAGKNKKEEA